MSNTQSQVSKDHYDFSRYVGHDRWMSYYFQIREVLAFSPSSVLEIGVGDRMLGDFLKQKTNITYQSLDIALDLHPDIIGSVENIPLPDQSVDCIVAFEILEHLPFDKFSQCLAEIARVSRGHAIMSLPHFGPPVKLLLKIPFLPEIRFAWKIPFPKAHQFNGEHYWEIGKKDYSPKRIRNEMKKHFHVLKEFVPFENQYHHFFVLKKK